MNILGKNKLNIDKRIFLGLNLIRSNYEIEEIETDNFNCLHIQDMDYTVKQYKIKDVGNLLVMTCKDCEKLQMDSFVITPYYKNLPLFSTDYIYMQDKRTFLNEIYGLVLPEDNIYNKYIKAFDKVRSEYEHFQDMPMRACWYDEIRPVYIAKNTEAKDDETILEIFMKNLKLFIQMEKEMSFLNETQYKEKWEKTQEYTDGLVDRGGVSTDVFKATLGAERTKAFFNEVFFAPTLYKK